MAVPLVILGFAGQWALPLLVCVVAGDIFSSEDHLGTWKTVLTRAVSRSHLFGGKLLAIAGYLVSLLVVLAIAALAAGLLVGHEPLVGLSGQRVTAGPATAMVLTSWCSVLLPTAGFGSLAVLISVLTRNSVAGIGGPVVLGLFMQLLALVDLPQAVQTALLSTGMLAWHGLWTVPSFTGPLWESSIVAVVWIGVSIGVAWVTFARRDVVLR
jgi:ABC-2 type transport system permease protein